ncbi:SWI/SNF family DNA-dependent ATPase [Colletotrichum tofieldiae]|nr:SWI/SNF family DNA-dependent ATPase [Colletotrichum tofieldiae]
MEDDPTSTRTRDEEALKALADELLELEGDRDLQRVIVESFETAPNPEAYSNEKSGAVRDLEAVNKTIEDKKHQKRRLEQRIQAARTAERHSVRDAAFGEDSNMWEARNRWGAAVEGWACLED